MKYKYLHLSYFILILFISCTTNNEDQGKQQAVVKEQEAVVTSNKIIGNFQGCGYNQTTENRDLAIDLPRHRESNQIESILAFSGLPVNFDIYSANIQNAIATIINGKRIILYDPALLDFTDQRSDSYWSSVSILAHEIGHHLSGHTLTNIGSNHRYELEADKYSGFVLYKLGASLKQATAAMNTLAGEYDSATHPAKSRRINAITKGWQEANSQRYSSAVPPPPANDNDLQWLEKDEFFPHDLVNEKILDDVHWGQQFRVNPRYQLEGIIIDVKDEDPTNGGRASFFNVRNTGLSKEITIELTKLGNYEGSSSKIGDREIFHLVDYYQMAKVHLTYLEAMLVPGRKIRFQSTYFGYGEEDIYYIKKLNRKKSVIDNRVNSVPSSCVVRTERAYFHSSPNSSSRRKAYLIRGDEFTIVRKENGYGYAEYNNLSGVTTKGWINLNKCSVQ